ncbi:hypothetical protein F0562_031630 [Nyssa sinensis]|uniref:Uncharacterized protein n=1 Tax=Nyssa sinensis TaxID=561372 RepID=A0A5J5AXI4_9ASTE|nr:hypothetical protein F0562_031630 [Nyssa sinensis]
MKSFSSSWEEQAFAEDAAGPLGGFIWPPRRDRARLKQSLSPQSELLLHHQNHIQQKSLDIASYPSQVYTLNPNSDSNSNPSFAAVSLHSPSRVSAISTQENFSDHTYVSPSIVQEHQKEFSYSSPRPSWSESKTTLEKIPRLIKDPLILVPDDTVETNLSVGLNLSDGDEGVCCKRHKITVPSLPFFLKPCSSDKYPFQSEVLGLRTSSMEDLDLELRLGDPAKMK